jgi:UDP-glucose 4-epimerase
LALVSASVLLVGAGQAGTFAAGSLERAGARVVAGDAKPAMGFFSRFSATRDAELIELDARDRDGVTRVIREHAAEIVVMTAGVVGQACDDDPDRSRQVNVDGAACVAAAAADGGARRMVLVSTLSVYGRSGAERVDESCAIAPSSEYGRTKAEAERLVLAMRDRGLDVRIVRPCGIYGPLRLGGGSHSARFIEAVLMSAARHGRVVVAAGPETDDQYLYVKDLGDAIASVALFEGQLRDRVFNVAPEGKTNARQLRDALVRVVPGVEVVIEDGANGDRDGRMPPLDSSRIREALGFEPRFSLEDGLADYTREAGFLR